LNYTRIFYLYDIISSVSRKFKRYIPLVFSKEADALVIWLFFGVLYGIGRFILPCPASGGPLFVSTKRGEKAT